MRKILFYLFCLVFLIFISFQIAARNSDSLLLYTPYGTTIVFTKTITVEGAVKDAQQIARVLINSNQAFISGDGRYRADIPLEIGKNTLDIVAVDKKNKVLAEKKKRLLRFMTFSDLGDDQWSRTEVEQLATLGITTGYPDGTFLPNNSITRAEIIAWIVKLLPGEVAVKNPDRFTDLTKDYWGYSYIMQATEAGLIEGYPDKSFRPNNTITRIEALAIVARFMKLPTYDDVVKSPFLDVKTDYWGFPIIISVDKAGLLTYVKTAYLGPTDQVSRGEVAVLLSKTKIMQDKVRDLYNFLAVKEAK